MSSSHVPYMDWKHSPLSEAFHTFRARMDLYFADIDLTDKAKQAIKIKISLGDEGMRRILASGISAADSAVPDKLYELIEGQVDASVRINYRVHRLEFSTLRQQPAEPISDFISRLREKASKCQLPEDELSERIIEMIVLSTPFEEFRRELLTKAKGHTLTDVLQRGRDYEAVQASQASLQAMSIGQSAGNVDALGKKTSHKKPACHQKSSAKGPCTNCGLSHEPKSCPAYKDTCSHCHSIGHWKKCCRKLQRE